MTGKKNKSQIISILFMCMLIISSVYLGVLKEQNSTSKQSDRVEENLSFIPLAKSSSNNINATYQSIDPAWMDNELLLNQSLSRTLNGYWNNESIQEHFPTISATFWWVRAMKQVDPTYLASYTSILTDFIMGCYNTSSGFFQEKRPYDIPRTGEYWIRNSNHPVISHHMAIIILAHLGTLNTVINNDQRMLWDSQIRNSHNPDGGFGVVFAPNSTIVETYYATYALYCLNNFSGLTISPSSRLAIGNYIASTQRQPEAVVVGVGAFSEYVLPNEYAYFGWTNYLAQFLAVQILRLIGWENKANMAIQYNYFLTHSYTYNTQYAYFYAEHNDFFRKTTKNYAGSTIMWDPIMYFGFNGSYNETKVFNTILESWTNKGWFRNHNQTTKIDCDLVLQALVLEQLAVYNKTHLFNATMRAALNATLLKFQTTSGGISFTPQWFYTPAYYLPISQKIGNMALNATLLEEMYRRLISFRYEDHFIAQRLIQQFDCLMFDMADNWLRYDVKVSYEVIRTFQEVGLLNRFMVDVGMNYLAFEQYFANQYLPSGVFRNSSTTATGTLESTYYALRAQKILIDNDFGASFTTYYSSDQFQTILNASIPYLSSNATDGTWSARAGDTWDIYQSTLYLLVINDICKGFNATFRIEGLLPFLNQELSRILNPIQENNLWQIIAYLARYYPAIAAQITIPIDHANSRTILQSDSIYGMQTMGSMLKLYRKHLVYYTATATNRLPLDKPTPVSICMVDHFSMWRMNDLLIHDIPFYDGGNLVYTASIGVTLDPATPQCFYPNVTFNSEGKIYRSNLSFIYNLTCNFSSFAVETNLSLSISIKVLTHAIHGQMLNFTYSKIGNFTVQVANIINDTTWVRNIVINKANSSPGSINVTVKSPFGYYFSEIYELNRESSLINDPSATDNLVDSTENSTLGYSNSTTIPTITSNNVDGSINSMYENNQTDSSNTKDLNAESPSTQESNLTEIIKTNPFNLISANNIIVLGTGIGICGFTIIIKKTKKIVEN